jgi:hypothetical protein
MKSPEIEEACEKIQRLWGDLHDALVTEEENAWIDLPAIGFQASPNDEEIRLSIQIGVNDSK